MAVQNTNEALLRSLIEFRITLARSFIRTNPQLNSASLAEVTQRTLDRLVFMRFLEDRRIESGRLVAGFAAQASGSAWAEFVATSRRLDGIYSGAVFKAHALDAATFRVDDAVFCAVCQSLATEPIYDFGCIPIHTLGTVYERFLSKVIVATEKGASVEASAARKAGGVFYTPEFIVRYIAENTVGKLIVGKSPDQIAAMRFADIACGSGSFLLGVYALLLQYHLDYYIAHPRERGGCCVEREGRVHLSLRKKQEILRNNVYGVDLDAQAVEVAQLSLYLKLLEDENSESVQAYRCEFPGPLLPPLDLNIVCGNALIGTDIFENGSLRGDDARKLNPTNFEDRFPEIMKRGGFDAIVGNPPYIQLSMGAYRNDAANGYLKKRYGFSGGRLNTFAFFVERAREKTRVGGKFAYILPNTVLSQEYYEELRRKLIANTIINAVAMPQGQIFKDAVVETVVLVLTKCAQDAVEIPKAKVEFVNLFENGAGSDCALVLQKELADNYKASFITSFMPELRLLRKKLEIQPGNLGQWLFVNQAIALKFDRAACLSSKKKTALHRVVLDGRNIARYYTGTSQNFFKFDLSKIHSCKREDIFLLPEKIFFRRVGDRLIGSLDTEKNYALNTLIVMSLKPECPYSVRYFLALFNSTLLNVYYVTFLKSSKKVFSEIQARQIEQLPLPPLQLSKPADKARHDQAGRLVDQMTEAKKQLYTAITDKERSFFESKCTALDRQIDRLVYELYGLNDDEIRQVEFAMPEIDRVVKLSR